MIQPSDAVAILVIPNRTATLEQVIHAATELAAKNMTPVIFYRGDDSRVGGNTITILPTDQCPCSNCAGRNPDLKIY